MLQENHAEQQAAAQLNSIVEMVAALTIEAAAAQFVAGLTDEEVNALIAASDGETDLTTDETRDFLTEEIAAGNIEPEDFEFDEDKARETIEEDALSVEVRSGWHSPGSEPEAPEEFMILLCTGGPAVRIVGDLDRYAQPERARLEYQDWGTPWTEYIVSSEDYDALLTYCQQFYFGEG